MGFLTIYKFTNTRIATEVQRASSIELNLSERDTYIRNSGENYNLLYKNDFDSVTYPAIANLKNSDFVQGDPFSIGTTGLEMKCNDFDHFNYAISVTGNMQKNQGSPNGGSSALAGNRFYTPTTTSLESEFIVSTSNPSLDINYYDYHHHNDTICIPDLRTITKVDLNPRPETFIENDACPDTPGGAKVITKSTNNSLFEIYTEFDDSISFVISDKQTELQQLVDNGNTLLLQAKAAGMNSANYDNVIQSLDLDGMLSDEVIFELMDNIMAPQAAKTQALIDNSPLPTKAKEKIDKMTDVDENLRNILLQYQKGENARETKEAEITRLKNAKAKNTSWLIKYVTHENDSTLYEQLIEFLEGQNTVKDNKIALRFATTQGYYDKADDILSNISFLSQIMNIDKQVELQNYTQLQSIAIKTEKFGELSDSIVNANSDFLFEIAADTLLPECAQAQALLEHTGLAEYPPVVYPPLENMKKSVKFHNNQNNYNTPEQDFIKIYPNPAKDKLFVEYAVFNYKEEEKHQIEVITQKGQLIKVINIDKPVGLITINIRNFTSGNYLLKFNNSVIKFTKM